MSADQMRCIIALTDGSNKTNLRIQDTENAKNVILLQMGQKMQASGYLNCDCKIKKFQIVFL